MERCVNTIDFLAEKDTNRYAGIDQFGTVDNLPFWKEENKGTVCLKLVNFPCTCGITHADVGTFCRTLNVFRTCAKLPNGQKWVYCPLWFQMSRFEQCVSSQDEKSLSFAGSQKWMSVLVGKTQNLKMCNFSLNYKGVSFVLSWNRVGICEYNVGCTHL